MIRRRPRRLKHLVEILQTLVRAVANGSFDEFARGRVHGDLAGAVDGVVGDGRLAIDPGQRFGSIFGEDDGFGGHGDCFVVGLLFMERYCVVCVRLE